MNQPSASPTQRRPKPEKVAGSGLDTFGQVVFGLGLTGLLLSVIIAFTGAAEALPTVGAGGLSLAAIGAVIMCAGRLGQAVHHLERIRAVDESRAEAQYGADD